MEELKKQNQFLSIQGAGGGDEENKTRYPIEASEGVNSVLFPRGGGNPGGVSLTQVEVLDLWCEGEAEGLVTGEYDYSFGAVGQVGYSAVPFTPYPEAGGVRWLRSVFWNDVPVVDSEGKFNFDSVNVKFTNGTPDGSSTSRIKPDLTVSRSIGERLRYGKDFAKVYRILNKNCKGVEINIRVPAISLTVAGRAFKGNASQSYAYPNERPVISANITDQNTVGLGDTLATAIHYRISKRPLFSEGDQQDFQAVLVEEIRGKISYGYIRSTSISFLNTQTDYSDDPRFLGWEVKIQRLTPDSINAQIRNTSYVDSLTEIYGDIYTYPNSAIIAQKFSAEAFSQVPKRSFDVKLLKVKVPSNYDPITKSYSPEPWDGTFKEQKEWTDNPAWCFYDLITNKRYGLGKYIPESFLDKWTLYNIGKYCDTLVDDGYGKFEPRFSCNLLINSREEAYKVVNDMASIFRAIVYYGAGAIFTVQDSKKTPIFQFTNANVEDGEFVYSSSSKRVRHTVALVRYNDNKNFYRPAAEYVEDVDGIRKYGIREVEVTAFGCTSRGQALRVGRWALLSETLETETVSFTAGLEGSYIRPGDVFKVYDSSRHTQRFGGRTTLIGNSAQTIRLDDYVTGIIPDSTYAFSLLTPTFYYDTSLVTENLNSDDSQDIRRGQIQKKSFLGSAASGVTGEDGNVYTEITFDAAFDTSNYIVSGNLIWTFEPSGVSQNTDKPIYDMYRAIRIEEKDSNKFRVQGLQYNEEKYRAIDSGLAFEDSTFGQRPPAPKSLILSVEPVTTNTKLINYAFIPTPSNLTSSYYVFAKTGDFAASDVSGSSYLIGILPTSITSGNYFPAASGDYYFRVYAVNKFGQRSETYASNHTTVSDIHPIRDVVISSLTVDSDSSDNAAGTRFTGIIETTSPTFKWQAGINTLASNYSTNLRYKVTVRQPSSGSFPSSNIYWTDTGVVGEAFTFDMETNASGVSTLGKVGPFREYDVVVEAIDDNGESSAGSNYNNKDGYDILYVNNPRPNIPLSTGACLPSSAFCTQQWITSDGDVRILFTKQTAINDLAGGYLYWSYAPFTKNQALGLATATGTIKRVTFNTISNPTIINANITGAKKAYVAWAPFDTFDSFLVNNGVNVTSGINLSSVVPVSRLDEDSNGAYKAWVELNMTTPFFNGTVLVDAHPDASWVSVNKGISNIVSTTRNVIMETTSTTYRRTYTTVQKYLLDIYFTEPFLDTNYGVTTSNSSRLWSVGGSALSLVEPSVPVTQVYLERMIVRKFTNRVRVSGVPDGKVFLGFVSKN